MRSAAAEAAPALLSDAALVLAVAETKLALETAYWRFTRCKRAKPASSAQHRAHHALVRELRRRGLDAAP